LLALYTRPRNLGVVLVAPVAMQFGPGAPFREPDLLFIARKHEDRLTADRLEGAADLIVEVVSDSSVARDRADKFYEYQDRRWGILDRRSTPRQTACGFLPAAKRWSLPRRAAGHARTLSCCRGARLLARR